ncbi:glycosyltransferase, partial [Enterococcus durans]
MCEISIIVPIYNVEQYLRKCVDSILAQTFTDFEVILVDDGSPDNSGAICDEYAKLDSRVRVIHKENGGLSDARNAGIEIAKGKYLGFVDSDDFIDKDMYEI